MSRRIPEVWVCTAEPSNICNSHQQKTIEDYINYNPKEVAKMAFITCPKLSFQFEIKLWVIKYFSSGIPELQRA
ncbi:5441_t:CDS:1, partial [Gigaspora rosea]